MQLLTFVRPEIEFDFFKESNTTGTTLQRIDLWIYSPFYSFEKELDVPTSLFVVRIKQHEYLILLFMKLPSLLLSQEKIGNNKTEEHKYPS